MTYHAPSPEYTVAPRPEMRWHRAWSVDLAAGTATHESGLVVRFTRAADDPAAWDGAADAASAETVLAALVAEHGPHNAPLRLARLMREAGETWTHAQHSHTRRGAAR